MAKHHIPMPSQNHFLMLAHPCANTIMITTQMPRTSPENLLGAIFSAEMATVQMLAIMTVLHGLPNITRQAVLHSLLHSALQCCTACSTTCFAVLNGLLAMASDASVASDASAVGVQVVRGLCVCVLGKRCRICICMCYMLLRTLTRHRRTSKPFLRSF